MSNSLLPIPALRLIYFSDTRGHNDFIRLILEISGIPYEDILIQTEYANMCSKGDLPFGRLPVLTIGKGDEQKTYGQSCAIARYCSKLGNLYPECPFDALLTDGVVDSWRDMTDRFYDIVFQYEVIHGKLQISPQPMSSRYEKLQMYLTYDLKPTFERYENLLTPYGQLDLKSTPNRFSWADLAIFDLIKSMQRSLDDKDFDDLMKRKPNLKMLVQRIEELDNIKAFYVRFPNTNISSHLWKKVSIWQDWFEYTKQSVLDLRTNFKMKILDPALASISPGPIGSGIK
jgi:glutathione S-transferase